MILHVVADNRYVEPGIAKTNISTMIFFEGLMEILPNYNWVFFFFLMNIDYTN